MAYYLFCRPCQLRLDIRSVLDYRGRDLSGEGLLKFSVWWAAGSVRVSSASGVPGSVAQRPWYNSAAASPPHHTKTPLSSTPLSETYSWFKFWGKYCPAALPVWSIDIWEITNIKISSQCLRLLPVKVSSVRSSSSQQQLGWSKSWSYKSYKMISATTIEVKWEICRCLVKVSPSLV